MLADGYKTNNKFIRTVLEFIRRIQAHLGIARNNLFRLLKLKHAHFRVANLPSRFGDDFKTYFITHNMPSVISKLKAGLDKTSMLVIDDKIDRLLNLPLANTKYVKSGMYSTSAFLKSILSPLQKSEANAYLKELPNLRKKYLGDFMFAIPFQPSNYRLPEAFYYHHGLKLVPKPVLDYIKGKVFLDCGANYGDSSVVFNEYSPSAVYAFDMNRFCEKRYYANLQLNKIDTSKFIFINKGLSKKAAKIKPNRQDYAAMTLQNGAKIQGEECTAELIAIDDFCKNQCIGLIQMDIEGFEIDAVLGAQKTIKRDKPLLLITIYHTPQQFFELKPLIESFNLGYTFMIRDLNPLATWSETTLICLPKIAQKFTLQG